MLIPILAAICAAGVLCVAYGVFIERKAYRLVRRPSLPILPAGSPQGMTILHMSDLHFVRGDAKKARFIAELPEADVTIVTGDFLAEPEAVETAVAAVNRARGKLASYFVLGSNDIYVPAPLNPLRYFRRGRKKRHGERGRAQELISQLADDGWTPLLNEHLDVMLGSLAVELVGLNDPHIGRHDMRIAPRHARETFGLAIAHAPEPAPELLSLGYDLVVAGHTHGGQVRAPWGPLVNNSTLPLSITSGLFRMGPGYLHISQGLGTSKYAPFRFLCRPQVELLELGPKPS